MVAVMTIWIFHILVIGLCVTNATSPDVPNSVNIKGVTSNSITIEIITIGTGTHYTAVYQQESTTKSVTFQSTGTSTTHIIDGLIPFTNYTFCVFTIVKESGKDDQNSTTCERSDPEHVATKRGPVEDIEIKDITETSFQVMWKRPIGTYIRLWIHHRQRGSAISQSISVPVNGVTVWTVTGFEPGRSYTVWMEIKYTISEGVEVSTNTSVLTKPRPPRSINSEPVDEYTIFVRWEQPIEGGYSTYEIYNNPPYRIIEENVTSISLSSYYNPGTNITVRIRTVVADNGITQYSSAIYLWQETRPMPPIQGSVRASATDHDSIALSWDTQQAFMEFGISIYPPDERNNSNFTVPGTIKQLTIHNLYPGRMYNLSVKSVLSTADSRDVFANGGEGQMTAPGPPGTIYQTRKHTHYIYLVWGRSISESGVDTYEVTIDKPGTIGDIVNQGLQFGVNITDLKPGIRICATVIAKVKDLKSNPSTRCFVTEEIPPETPMDFKVDDTSATTVTLSWAAPSITNGVILSYTVSYKICSQSVGWAYQNVGLTTERRITRLKSGIPYEFRVVAANSKGQGEMTSPLVQPTDEDFSGRVSDLKSTDVMARNASFSWTLPVESNGIITHYLTRIDRGQSCFRGIIFHVTYTIPDDTRCWNDSRYSDLDSEKQLDVGRDLVEDCEKLITGPTVDSTNIVNYTIEELTPFTKYNISVFPINAKGTGERMSLEIESKQDAPEGSPQSVYGYNISSTSLKIEWGETLSPNGIITNYAVKYWETSGGVLNSVEILTNSTMKTWTISRLKIFTKYTFVVRSFNIFGVGPWSAEYTGSTGEGAPGRIATISSYPVSSFSINLRWGPPDTTNGIIRSYNIYFNNGTKIGSSSLLAFTVTDLTPWTEYCIDVSAVTIIEGPSIEVCTTTKEDYSGRVTNLNSIAKTSLSITAFWQYPNQPNGLLTHYILRVETEIGNCVEGVVYTIIRNPQTEVLTKLNPMDEINDCFKNGTAATKEIGKVERDITGLNPYTNYTIKVHGWSGPGLGQESNITKRTLEDVPEDVPLSIKAFPDKYSVKMSFTFPAISNGVITMAESHITRNNEEVVFQNHTIGFAQTFTNQNGQASVVNLQPFTNYSIKLRICTSVGSGPWGDTLHTATLEAAPAKVRNLTATILNEGAISINWIPPNVMNGHLRHYTIRCFQQSTGHLQYQRNQTGNSYDVQDLPVGNYTISVAAVTVEEGDSEEVKGLYIQERSNVGAIIGGVIGGVVLLIIICIVIVIILRRKNRLGTRKQAFGKHSSSETAVGSDEHLRASQNRKEGNLYVNQSFLRSIGRPVHQDIELDTVSCSNPLQEPQYDNSNENIEPVVSSNIPTVHQQIYSQQEHLRASQNRKEGNLYVNQSFLRSIGRPVHQDNELDSCSNPLEEPQYDNSNENIEPVVSSNTPTVHQQIQQGRNEYEPENNAHAQEDVSPSNQDKTDANIYANANVIKNNHQFNKEEIKLFDDGRLGSGNFGDVIKGMVIATGVNVAVKVLKDTASDKAKLDIMEELALMKLFDHPNVVKLHGWYRSDGTCAIVLEYLCNGSLLSQLKGRRHDLHVRDLVKFGLDTSLGMGFLHSQKVVHRDLAARNILLDEDFTCKVSDFGLSRDVYEQGEYVTIGAGGPWKWWAPEVITTNRFTFDSDVWSFGVLLWEIFSFGDKPYRKMKNTNLAEYLKNGNRLEKPEQSPDNVYDLMKRCWSKYPKQRPSFDNIALVLKRILEDL